VRVPHASVLRVGICVMRKRLNRYCGRGHLHFLAFRYQGEAGQVIIDSVGGQNPGDNRPKLPHANPACRAPQFISRLGVRATRPGHANLPIGGSQDAIQENGVPGICTKHS